MLTSILLNSPTDQIHLQNTHSLNRNVNTPQKKRTGGKLGIEFETYCWQVRSNRQDWNGQSTETSLMHFLPPKKELNVTSLFVKVKGNANANLLLLVSSSKIYLSPIRCTSSSYWEFMSGHNLSTDTRFMCFLSRLLVSHRCTRDQKQHQPQQSS